MSNHKSNHKDTIINSYWMDKSRFIGNIPQPAFVTTDNINSLSSELPNIYIQVEPSVIYDVDDYLIQNHNKYHTIITYNKKILDNCPNAKFYIPGTNWIDYKNISTDRKAFKISNLAGSKNINSAPGHIFRQILHSNQHLLKDYPITFFRSTCQGPSITDYGNNPLLSSEKKDELFETFQFAIVIENSKQINYFTEKIMDCVLSRTIPIYWGCPNISDFFDTTGWIILDTTDVCELTQKLKLLNEDYYGLYKDTIEKNYIKAEGYSDFYENVSSAVKL